MREDLGCHMDTSPSAAHAIDDAESMRELESPLLELLLEEDVRCCPNSIKKTHLSVVSRGREREQVNKGLVDR
jgi:hypothetical protein